MGNHQARRLIEAGHLVTVNDLNEQAVARLVAKGALQAKSPEEIASASQDVIITMLPSSPHVKFVYEEGIFKGLKKKTLLIDCSTIDPSVSRQLATSSMRLSNSAMLDCPVSGGTRGAEEGTLTFMVGGDKEAFDQAKPILALMGKNIVYCGTSGSGQVVKLCNNLILGISMIGVSEAMNLGTSLGVDAGVLAGVINTSSGRCWSSDTYNPAPGIIPTAPSNRGYAAGFMTQLMKKDVGLAVDAANSVAAPVPLGQLAHKIYDLIGSQGCNEKDFSVVYQVFQQHTQAKKPFEITKDK